MHREGYVVPIQPITVAFPEHDQEKEEDKEIAPPPPAYGLWRHSIRVNPDQFYWVRRNSGEVPEERDAGPQSGGDGDQIQAVEQEARAAGGNERTVEGARPPSYVSEEGVDYVLAGPRRAGTEVLRSAGRRASVGSVPSTGEGRRERRASSVDGLGRRARVDISPARLELR